MPHSLRNQQLHQSQHQQKCYFEGLADKNRGHVIDSPIPDSRSRIVREPVGVCGQITPWNYPLMQKAAWKVAPALAAGNTVVLKPSEITPLTTIKMAEFFDEAGIPPGVINVVLGPGESVGTELSISHDVDLISFTVAGKKGNPLEGIQALQEVTEVYIAGERVL